MSRPIVVAGGSLILGFVYLVWLTLAMKEDWRKIKERERKDFGECLSCGYDLRATPECCPECGTSVAAKPVTNA